MSIYLTGASGFVGKNIIEFFRDKKTIIKATRITSIEIEEEVIIV